MPNIKIALIGYGKMGQILKELSSEYSMDVVAIIDPSHKEATAKTISKDSLKDVDLCIEFTTPETAVKNIESILRLNIPVVVGTTGWYDHLDYVKKIVDESKSSVVWAPNFSLGIAFLMKLTEQAAEFAGNLENLEVSLVDLHHKDKKDAPSGTASALKECMQKKGINVDVSSMRIGNECGTHIINFSLPSEKVTLTHTLESREPLARGVLKAASLIPEKAGMYHFYEILP